jgi:hypothetical protein
VVVALLLLSGIAIAWARNPPGPDVRLLATVGAAAQRPCARVEIIGLRGHGDPPGPGADVSALARMLLERLGPQGALEVFGFPYEQGPSLHDLPLSVARDIPPAATAVRVYVERRARACPNERMLIVGQSEGAAVAHWAYPEVSDRVAGVVLLGDPLRLPSTRYDVDLGAAGDGQLVGWLELDPLSLRFRDRISDGGRNVRSYCLPHDQVCGFNLFDGHRDTHLDYRANTAPERGGERVLDRAADFLMSSLAAR